MITVAIEGFSTSHKSSVLSATLLRLGEAGIAAFDSRPSLELDGSVAKQVQRITRPVSSDLSSVEELLLYSTRVAHKSRVLRSQWNEWQVGFLDRFTMSVKVLAHHVRGLPERDVDQILAVASSGISPDLTFLLDVSEEAYSARMNSNGRTYSRKQQGGPEIARLNIEGFRRESAKVGSKILDSTRLSIDEMAEVISADVLSQLPPSVRFVRDEPWAQMPNELRLVVLDLEGTLFSDVAVGEENARLAIQAVSESMEVSSSVASESIRTTRMHLSRQAGYEVAVTAVLKELGVSLSVWSRYQRRLTSVDRLKRYDHLVSAIARVSALIPLVVATNMTKEPALRVLARLGLAELSPHLFTSDDDQYVKPSVQMYRKICAEYGCSPLEVLSVGDRFEVDLASLISLGGRGRVVAGPSELTGVLDEIRLHLDRA